ncbi:glyceraldehyde-3-phosphate dehydrogenase [Pseudobacter ginsenosidimutans]|uniref:glyceraldehyde-3-phosphate dehydrogenase n=1 Tax=Pseudobacter ginsenosidimutans TaxID=661488 RepID=UPI00102D92FF|nr:glyceraldehyde-3-phosphate dehydrogenase [Pseudobacter ginsenosidimutans]QEC44335.1 aldehyde dehydrogenase [Pseudobacter ginsenosidimutans]
MQQRERWSGEINELLKHHAHTDLKGVLEYTEEPFVSADILGNPHSSIVDGTLTRSIDKLVKIVSWYDNVAGISNRIAELAVELAAKMTTTAEA